MNSEKSGYNDEGLDQDDLDIGRILNQVRNGGKHLWYSTVVVHKCRRW